MKLKRNGAMVFWSIGGIGGSVYATKNTRIVFTDIIVPAAVGMTIGLLCFAVLVHIVG